MNEKLYTIPVQDAFSADCECPICVMKQTLERASIEYTLGPSYMEDDIRMVTDKHGFCSRHVKELYGEQNRLGLALMLKTHMDNVIKETEKLAGKGGAASPSSFFKKKEESKIPVVTYLNKLENSCFICSRVENVFDRYIATIFYLYEKEKEFRALFANSKGFCNNHYALLYENASSYLRGDKKEEFIISLNKVYLENMKRVRDDLDWFIDKFDYVNADKPWKNSQDALPRTIIKTNSTNVEPKLQK